MILKRTTSGLKEEDETETKQESRVGQLLNELSTMKLIILILAMLISAPLLSYETYIKLDESTLMSL
jgi:hypothetical protein